MQFKFDNTIRNALVDEKSKSKEQMFQGKNKAYNIDTEG